MIDKESIFELQKIDANCNDCIFFNRDLNKYNSHNLLYTNEKGQVTNPSYRIHYGRCGKFNKDVSCIPNTCQLDTQHCFQHRKEIK